MNQIILALKSMWLIHIHIHYNDHYFNILSHNILSTLDLTQHIKSEKSRINRFT